MLELNDENKELAIKVILCCLICLSMGAALGMSLVKCKECTQQNSTEVPDGPIPQGSIIMQDRSGCAQNLSMHCCIEFQQNGTYTIGQIYKCD